MDVVFTSNTIYVKQSIYLSSFSQRNLLPYLPSGPQTNSCEKITQSLGVHNWVSPHHEVKRSSAP